MNAMLGRNYTPRSFCFVGLRRNSGIIEILELLLKIKWRRYIHTRIINIENECKSKVESFAAAGLPKKDETVIHFHYLFHPIHNSLQLLTCFFPYIIK